MAPKNKTPKVSSGLTTTKGGFYSISIKAENFENKVPGDLIVVEPLKPETKPETKKKEGK